MINGRIDDDQEAIDMFFRLLAEFKERTPHIVAKLIGFKKSYSYSIAELDELGRMQLDDSGRIMGSPTIIRPYPDSISLVTYTNNQGFFAYSDTSDSMPREGYFPDFRSFELDTGANWDMLTIVDPKWDPQPFKHKREKFVDTPKTVCYS